MPGQSVVGRTDRPRELRCGVMLRTRLRTPWGWSTACILNISSRGLMINAGAAAALAGESIELWHGEHVIVATVVWRKGTRAVIRADERVPVDEILAIGEEASFQLQAGDRPKKPGNFDGSRLRERAMEFAGIAGIAVSLAGGTLMMAVKAFARPLGLVQAALGG